MGVCEAVPLLTPTDENGDEEPPIELMTDYTPDMGDKTFSNRQCKVDVNQNPQFQMLDYSYSHSSCATPLNNDEWEPAPEEEGALCNANPNGYQEATKWFCTADDELINAISGISTATFKGTTCDSNSEIVKMSIKPANTCMPDTVTGADESFTYTSCMKDAAGGTELTVGYSMYDGKECAGEPKNTGFVQMDAECISDGDGTMNGLVCHNFN